VLTYFVRHTICLRNCQPVHDHPDLQGHQPDPAHRHGPATS